MIQDIAQRYFAEIDRTMRQIVALAPDAPDLHVMLKYPLGWVDEHDQPYDRATGKRIRPMVVLLCAEAAGGDWHDALPAAAAVELLHNFTLIHDDIQDDSPTRHGRPTVWQIWGRPNAINAGDALFTLAYVALQRLETTSTPAVTLGAWRIFNETMLELTRGQHLDMRFEQQADVSVDEYISMIRGKTSALLSACAQIGALVGSGDAETARHYAEFGLNLGIAFQIHDDILGIWGDETVTGKSTATDILSKKKSLPVLYGLAQSNTLVKIYERPQFSDADVHEAVALLDAAGARTYATGLENTYYERALAALEAAEPIGAAGQLLRGLAAWLFARAY
ncbi:MAG: polyprenyl synthetase family protein [Anaerolineae bacterium]|nr:polyprenyl synthetase family protein [Anaerolineae bacterium]